MFCLVFFYVNEGFFQKFRHLSLQATLENETIPRVQVKKMQCQKTKKMIMLQPAIDCLRHCENTDRLHHALLLTAIGIIFVIYISEQHTAPCF